MVRKKIPRQRLLLGLVAFVLTLLILTFYLWHLAETTRLGLAKRDLETKLTLLQDEIRTLEARKTALLSPARVEKVARQDLKMAEPQPGQVVYDDVSEPHR
jgi:cell division protein FtsL